MTEQDRICKQLEALLQTEAFYVPAMANASALLWEALSKINWVGFYIVRVGRLERFAAILSERLVWK